MGEHLYHSSREVVAAIVTILAGSIAARSVLARAPASIRDKVISGTSARRWSILLVIQTVVGAALGAVVFLAAAPFVPSWLAKLIVLGIALGWLFESQKVVRSWVQDDEHIRSTGV